MFATIKSVFLLIYYFLKMYFYGGIALVRQIFQTHKQEDQLLHTGFVAIVTGGSEGIGFEVSRSLVSKNVHVIIGSKCTDQGKMALTKIREEFPNSKVDWIHLDLTSFKSIKDFVDSFLAMGLSLNILINNAGVMLAPYTETEDRLEEHIQVNYLGHFYLTSLLLEVLKNSGGDNYSTRIINVTSIVHKIGVPDIDVICRRYENTLDYSSHAAYCNSKLAVTLWSFMLARILQEQKTNVTVNVVHPGIVNTQLYRHIHWSIKWLLDLVAAVCYKTADMGADSILYLALSPTVEGHTGGYYDNCTKSDPHWSSQDKTLQDQLVNKSLEIVKDSTGVEIKL